MSVKLVLEAGACCGLLCLELVGHDEVGFAQERLVLRYLVFWDVELAVVAHDWIQHCLWSAPAIEPAIHTRTPEEASWFRSSIELDIPANLPYRLYRLSARHISRQHHIEVGQVRLAKSLV
jgi:hypothetical protein